MSDPLATYLHDHLGGARAAIDLLEAMRDRQKDKLLSDFAAHLLTEVQADRDTLQHLAENAGSGSNVLKELTGWLAEKVTRLKLGQGSGQAFGLFEALEFLALGVRGKMGLWQALDVAAASDTRLSGYDFKHLTARAEKQYQQVEQQRLRAAEIALNPQPAQLQD
jgi:hypothetical protein